MVPSESIEKSLVASILLSERLQTPETTLLILILILILIRVRVRARLNQPHEVVNHEENKKRGKRRYKPWYKPQFSLNSRRLGWPRVVWDVRRFRYH